MDKKHIVITYGTFDLLHEGHLNLLRRARRYGDVLIVGVTSDAYDRLRGKLNVRQSLAERIENVRRTGLADLIVVEEYDGQKIEDIHRYNVDTFVIGSDWKGKFDYLKQYCKVVYLERTRGVSSSGLRGLLRIGIIGPGRIARRFINEAKYVSGAFVNSVYHPRADKAQLFANEFELEWGGGKWEAFMERVDAVYISTPHHLHVDFALRALESDKHVLVEKPMALSRNDALKLYHSAQNKGKVIMEAIKTAYLPAFRRAIGMALAGSIGDIRFIDANFTKLMPQVGREFDPRIFGGSFTELGSYVLLPIVKLLGSSLGKEEVKFYTWLSPTSGVDLFTVVEIAAPGLIAHGRVALGVKGEGHLIIGGTKGYIFIPAPWWKTGHFEIRRENQAENRVISDAYEGEGLRFEIAEFVKATMSESFSQWYRPEESVWLASVIEQFIARSNVKIL